PAAVVAGSKPNERATNVGQVDFPGGGWASGQKERPPEGGLDEFEGIDWVSEHEQRYERRDMHLRRPCARLVDQLRFRAPAWRACGYVRRLRDANPDDCRRCRP